MKFITTLFVDYYGMQVKITIAKAVCSQHTLGGIQTKETIKFTNSMINITIMKVACS